jgi:hypothetical protein
MQPCKNMSAKINYMAEPIGEPNVIKDFLRSPAELAFNEQQRRSWQDQFQRLRLP